jgi:hypothetical protein
VKAQATKFNGPRELAAAAHERQLNDVVKPLIELLRKRDELLGKPKAAPTKKPNYTTDLEFLVAFSKGGTQEDIAQRLHISEQAVSARLPKFGIKTFNIVGRKFKATEAQLRRAHKLSGGRAGRSARLLRTSDNTLKLRWEEVGLQSAFKKNKVSVLDYINAYAKNLNTTDAGKLLGVSQQHVSRKWKKLGLPIFV